MSIDSSTGAIPRSDASQVDELSELSEEGRFDDAQFETRFPTKKRKFCETGIQSVAIKDETKRFKGATGDFHRRILSL